MADATEDPVLIGPYMALGHLLLKQAKNRASFAQHMADSWATLARLEKHEAEKERLDWRKGEKRTPSGTMPAVIDGLKHPKDDE